MATFEYFHKTGFSLHKCHLKATKRLSEPKESIKNDKISSNYAASSSLK